MFSDNCCGRNLLNYIKQKNIPYTLEQELYKSDNLYDREEEYWKLPYYEVFIVLKMLENKEELEKSNTWKTKFVFQDKTYWGNGSSKISSLEEALEKADSDIRDYF